MNTIKPHPEKYEGELWGMPIYSDPDIPDGTFYFMNDNEQVIAEGELCVVCAAFTLECNLWWHIRHFHPMEKMKKWLLNRKGPGTGSSSGTNNDITLLPQQFKQQS